MGMFTVGQELRPERDKVTRVFRTVQASESVSTRTVAFTINNCSNRDVFAHVQRSTHCTTFHQRSTPNTAANFSAGASAQPPLRRGPATATAIAAIFRLQISERRRAIQRTARRRCQLDLERQRSQRRQLPTPTCPRTWCRARPAVALIDAPTRQPCAAHAPATVAAMAPSRRGGAIRKGATSASWQLGRHDFPLSSDPRCPANVPGKA